MVLGQGGASFDHVFDAEAVFFEHVFLGHEDFTESVGYAETLDGGGVVSGEGFTDGTAGVIMPG